MEPVFKTPRRLFLALWPPRELAEKLHAQAIRALRDERARVIPAVNLHLTLVFLGLSDTERLACCENAIGHLVLPDPFLLAIDRLGCWRRRGLLWAGCSTESPALAVFVAALNDALNICGHTPETRAFKTHITLARYVHHYAGPASRQAGGERRRGDPLDAIEPLEWAVDGINLVASELHPEGARYEILRRWCLADRGVQA